MKRFGLIPPRVPIIWDAMGRVSREWWRWFNSVQEVTDGGASGTIADISAQSFADRTFGPDYPTQIAQLRTEVEAQRGLQSQVDTLRRQVADLTALLAKPMCDCDGLARRVGNLEELTAFTLATPQTMLSLTQIAGIGELDITIPTGNLVINTPLITTPPGVDMNLQPGTTGNFFGFSANISSASTTGQAGVNTGGNTGSGDTGIAFLGSGDSSAGNSGDINIFSGAANGAGKASGNVQLEVGPATGGATAGLFNFINATDASGASIGTLTNAPHAANPSFWIKVRLNGTVSAIPAWTV